MDVYFGCRDWDGIRIEEGEEFSSLIEKLLKADRLIVDTDCESPDVSLVAYLARLLDLKVYWVGSKEPRGQLRRFVSGRI